MSGSEAQDVTRSESEEYSFFNLPPEGSKEESAMIAWQAQAFISLARMYLNGKYSDARVFTDTTDLIFQSLERTLQFVRDKNFSFNDERHFRCHVGQKMEWFLQDELKKERKKRRNCVSLDDFTSGNLPARNSLEQDIDLTDTLMQAKARLRDEDQRLHEVLILTQQGLSLEQIGNLLNLSRSRVGELRAIAIAKVRLFIKLLDNIR